MLSLQIILTYKSRLKYGNQKNSWKVSINHKTPVVVFVKSASESWAWKEMKWVFLSHCGAVAVRLQAGRGEWVTEDSSIETESSWEPLSTWWISLISEDSSGHPYKVCHPSTQKLLQTSCLLIGGETLGSQACIIRTLSVIRTSHWTFNFSLGRSLHAGKVLTVHSFCSILEPADVWLERPALFDVVLFWECPAVKKILSIQIKGKYFCIQLLAVTCLPFFRALAWCHPQARLQTYIFSLLLRRSSNIHSAQLSPVSIQHRHWKGKYC